VHDQINKRPILYSWLYFLASHTKKLHCRLPREKESINRSPDHFGVYAIFFSLPYERWQIPPYAVDAAGVFAGSLFVFRATGMDWSAAVWKAYVVTVTLLIFRLVSFAVFTFFYTLCHEAPRYRSRLTVFYVIPGIPFRLLYALDVVIPQALFMWWWFGPRIGELVVAVSVAQFLYRVGVQRHYVCRPLIVIDPALDCGVAAVAIVIGFIARRLFS